MLRSKFIGCLVDSAIGDASGGDTDTIGAMTGVISDACHGAEDIRRGGKANWNVETI